MLNIFDLEKEEGVHCDEYVHEQAQELFLKTVLLNSEETPD